MDLQSKEYELEIIRAATSISKAPLEAEKYEAINFGVLFNAKDLKALFET